MSGVFLGMNSAGLTLGPMQAVSEDCIGSIVGQPNMDTPEQS